MEAVLDGTRERVDPAAASPWRSAPRGDGPAAVATWPDVQKTRDRLQRLMIEGAGVVRSAASLAAAGASLERLRVEMGDGTPTGRDHGELANLATAAGSVLRAATLREETRGAHARSDHPDASERWHRRIVHDAEGVSVGAGPATLSPAEHPSR
jgi:L-aspartate oxidase